MADVLTALPTLALDRHSAILGKTGAGKTYAARGEVEQLLTRGERVCVLDPTGVWWGLRLESGGARESGWPVVIFGGDHADVPIDGASGARLAQLIAAGDVGSCVIDVSRFTVGERNRFAADFAEELARANRDPLHLVVDEAHMFAPQGSAQQDPVRGRMVGAFNHLVSGGRALGLRIMLLSQRPAKLHKDSLTQVDTLVVMNLKAPQDTTAVKAWIADQADAKLAGDVLASLPGLKAGEGWVWAPELELLERVRFRAISTFDSSAAPARGVQRREPAKLASLDLAALAEALAGEDLSTEAAAPAQVGRKRKEKGGSASTSEHSVSHADHLEAIARCSHESQAAGFRGGLQHGFDAGYASGFGAGMRAAQDAVASLKAKPKLSPAALETSVSLLLMKLPNEAQPSSSAAGPTVADAAPPPPPAEVGTPEPAAAPSGGGGKANYEAGAAKLIEAIATAPRPVTSAEAALLAVLSPDAGYTRGAFKLLADSGSVQGGPGAWEPVVKRRGRADAAEIVDAWGNKLGGAAARILRHLYVVVAQNQEEVAGELGLSSTAGYTRQGWKKLRSLGLIDQVEAGRWSLAKILRDLKSAGAKS